MGKAVGGVGEGVPLGPDIREQRSDDGMLESSPTLPTMGFFVHAQRAEATRFAPEGVLREVWSTIASRLRPKGDGKAREGRLAKRGMAHPRPVLGNLAFRNHGPPQKASAAIHGLGRGSERRPSNCLAGDRVQVRQPLQVQLPLLDGVVRGAHRLETSRGAALLDFPRLLFSSLAALRHY